MCGQAVPMSHPPNEQTLIFFTKQAQSEAQTTRTLNPKPSLSGLPKQPLNPLPCWSLLRILGHSLLPFLPERLDPGCDIGGAEVLEFGFCGVLKTIIIRGPRI